VKKGRSRKKRCASIHERGWGERGDNMEKIALSGAMFGDDILTHIQVAGEVGYQGVELRGMGPLIHGTAEESLLTEIRDGLNRWNLFPICFSAWLGCYALRENDQAREKELEHSGNFFGLAQKLQCPHVRVNPSRLPPFEADESHWRTDSEWLARTADRAKEFGVSIYMEMHHGTLCDTKDNALRLLEMIGRDNVGLVFDPYNLYQIPTDCGIRAIQALAKAIVNVHVKDLVALLDNSYPYAFEFEAFVPHAGRFIPVQAQRSPREKRYFANRLINQGGLDWYHIIAALESAGYDGYLTVESTTGKDPNMLQGKELAAHCLREVQKLIETVGR
jgi:sugar phosphate isomerase/epimerase